MSTAILTIAIATVAERLDRIVIGALPRLDGVCFQIFVQGAKAAEIPAPQRPDITLIALEGRGLSRSRNEALRRTMTPLLLFADDDLEFAPEGLRQLLARFDALPDASFLCTRMTDEFGQPRKCYAPDGTAVRWWKCGRVGSPEIAVRPQAFRDLGLAFDTRFGAGTANHLGEEYIFLCDALRAGLRGRHVDITIASHPRESSGTRQDPAGMEIRRSVLIRALGRWKNRPARMAFALRHWRRFSGWRARWRFIS